MWGDGCLRALLLGEELVEVEVRGQGVCGVFVAGGLVGGVEVADLLVELFVFAHRVLVEFSTALVGVAPAAEEGFCSGLELGLLHGIINLPWVKQTLLILFTPFYNINRSFVAYNH